MAEEEPEGLDGGSQQDGPLEDHISHWVEVLDRWIKRVDLGMGRPDGDVDGADGAAPGIDGSQLRVDEAVDGAKGVES
jgi:hypothetical protein